MQFDRRSVAILTSYSSSSCEDPITSGIVKLRRHHPEGETALDKVTGGPAVLPRSVAAPSETEHVQELDDLRVGVGDDWVRDVIAEVQTFTMTSQARIYGLCLAVQHVVRNAVPGSIVECGVWRGGSSMAMARSLQHANDLSRQLILFDTFSGMTAPTTFDRDLSGNEASAMLSEQDPDSSLVWARAPLDEVRRHMESTGYVGVRYVEGDVLDTLPDEAPRDIALLRLDTDWYESTKHELVHLFPRISRGGILIIDDYGHWSGARRAVDEYLEEHSLPIFLCPLDYTGRLAIVRSPV